MPSTTFFNLPAEKREKLEAAAAEEFARVPYEKASINRMIRAAGIPRGSFYMYFEDKADLFRHLVGLPQEKVAARMADTLDRQGGDIFAAALDYYDQAMDTFRQHQKNPFFEKTAGIMMKNLPMGRGFMEQGMSDILRRLGGHVDAARLDLRGEDDLELMLKLLLGLVGSNIMAGLCAQDPAGERAKFTASLDILRRGMEKTPQ